jgi:DNA-binding response OmpR family regulator
MYNILIAEDEQDLREFLRDELEEAHFAVTIVENGANAIVAAVERSFDLVLLDMLMPGLDGIQTIQVLRKIKPNLPIIGLTGFVGRGYLSQASNYGVTCLTKPIDVDDLIQEINDHLH